MIAAIAPWHVAHQDARAAVSGGEVGLPAHVAFETTSALSRMPEGKRLSPVVVLEALKRAFAKPWLTMDADGMRDALDRAVGAGVRGGALYDALIAATAAHHGAEIVSADRRAAGTYQAMGVEVTLLDGP